MTDTNLLVQRDGAVLRLTLNRPTVGNALDIPLARRLMEEIMRADEDDSVRCILIGGNGRLFCAGGDVSAFARADEQLPVFLKEITAYLHSAIARLTSTEKPVVIAVNGAAAGAGVGLALIGDIVLGGHSAQFTLAYTGIGLSPDGATTWLLPRLVGLRRAQELALTNRRVKSDEAVSLGLLSRVVSDDMLDEEAMKVAQELADGATRALGATRRLLRDSFSNGIEAQMELESRAIAALGRSADGREGIEAFVERRSPRFSGR